MSQYPYGEPTMVQPIYGYSHTPLVPRTNALAVTAFVTSVLGFSVVPIIFGHLAMQAIRRTGERGSVLAVIGLVLGYFQVAFIALMIGLAVLADMGS
jgi:hypothetical protein